MLARTQCQQHMGELLEASLKEGLIQDTSRSAPLKSPQKQQATDNTGVSMYSH